MTTTSGTPAHPKTVALVRKRRLVLHGRSHRLIKGSYFAALIRICSSRCNPRWKNRNSAQSSPNECGRSKDSSPRRSRTTVCRARNIAAGQKCRSKPICARWCRTSNACSSCFTCGSRFGRSASDTDQLHQPAPPFVNRTFSTGPTILWFLRQAENPTIFEIDRLRRARRRLTVSEIGAALIFPVRPHFSRFAGP